MIQLVKSAHHPRLTSINGVPPEALSLVKEYEPIFDEDSVLYEDGTWAECSDLSLDIAEELKQKLIAAGFECEIVENPYKD